jgi:hypothetical protein
MISLGTRPRSDTLANPLARAQVRISLGPLLRAPERVVRRLADVLDRPADPGRAWATNGAVALSNSLPWVTQRSIRYC